MQNNANGILMSMSNAQHLSPSTPDFSDEIELTTDDLRQLVSFAVACAQKVLPIYEQHMPDDLRPRQAIQAATVFAASGSRSNALRMAGLAAFKASGSALNPAAKEAAKAATQAVGAAYLHPIAKAHQVEHILGAASHAARAAELQAGDDPEIAAQFCQWTIDHAPATVRTVLASYPNAPAGGGRSGELLRLIDSALRP